MEYSKGQVVTIMLPKRQTKMQQAAGVSEVLVPRKVTVSFVVRGWVYVRDRRGKEFFFRRADMDAWNAPKTQEG